MKDPKAYLFQNSDPMGSLKANVATAVVKQLSNLKLDVLLENRDALSRKVREEVTPTSVQWGFSLGSTYIRKVAFRDKDRDALRRAIKEDLARRDWEAALVLVDDMETTFGYGAEAATFRQEINNHRQEVVRQQVHHGRDHDPTERLTREREDADVDR